jgi:hypothetical protein
MHHPCMRTRGEGVTISAAHGGRANACDPMHAWAHRIARDAYGHSTAHCGASTTPNQTSSARLRLVA